VFSWLTEGEMHTPHIQTVGAVYSPSTLGGSLLCALYVNGLKVCVWGGGGGCFT
jgi:hypothetical protein